MRAKTFLATTLESAIFAFPVVYLALVMVECG